MSDAAIPAQSASSAPSKGVNIVLLVITATTTWQRGKRLFAR